MLRPSTDPVDSRTRHCLVAVLARVSSESVNFASGRNIRYVEILVPPRNNRFLDGPLYMCEDVSNLQLTAMIILLHIVLQS